MFKQKKKSAVTRITTDFGGELGIRTLGWLITNMKFRVSHLRPLGQLSQSILNLQEPLENGENSWREQAKILNFQKHTKPYIMGFSGDLLRLRTDNILNDFE